MMLEEEDCLELECKATGFPYVDYTWYHVTITNKGKEERVSIHTKHNDGQLRIPNVNESNTGNYICKAQNSMIMENGRPSRAFSQFCQVQVHPRPVRYKRIQGGNESSNFQITIAGPPLIIRQPEAVTHKNYGESFALVCEATQPESNIYFWEKDETLIRGANESKYVIHNCTMHDTGEYRCIIRNVHGERQSRIASVLVFPNVRELRMMPRIIRQPTNKTEEIGGMVNFCIQAEGRGQLFYQWHKNNKEIPGETRNNLTFTVENRGAAGVYQCRVYNKERGGELSQAAQLNISDSAVRYTAQDKVALIIGVAQYKHHKSLLSVKNDVKEAMEKFFQLGFKVVSLLDLTLEEMQRALTLFHSILDEGVYGLIYVAGHGFAHQGKHYLIPWDAHTHTEPQEALCLEAEEKFFQEKKPALLLFFVDVCREECVHGSTKDKLSKGNYYLHHNTTRQTEQIMGNRAIFFAASASERAFAEDSVNEKGQESELTCPWGLRSNRSIFSQYLMDVILQDLSIPDLWMSFLETYQRKFKHGVLPQHPELYTNMLKDRKLTDHISFAGETDKMNTRIQRWLKAHSLPPNTRYKVEQLGNFGVNYSSITSNIMEMEFVPEFIPSILEWGVECIEASVPNEIKPIKYVVAKEERDKLEYVSINTTVKLRIANLQRLRNPLKLQLVLKLQLDLSDQQRVLPCQCPVTIDIGTPLVSSLQYTIPLHSHKEPEEQEEGDTDNV